MREFVVNFEGVATISLSNSVIDAVDDEWREFFYQLDTPEEVAAHIAYNMVINKCNLSNLDGWANLPNHAAKITGFTWDLYAKELENAE